MQPDLPWNVVGIPPEAREAARAAARREGLSIGEWLTRRILRSFTDAPDGAPAEERPSGDNWHQSAFKSVEEKLSAAAPASRETDEMLSRVARAENESSDVYRRIEEQLRAVARRLESNDRNQAENNRAMNKAAMEINIATREQAQAFDQLGSHVVGLADRLKRVEQQANTETLREAVKGLHQGLSRLADQITETTRQSATQISALVNNVDAIATKLADTQNGTRSLEDRLVSLDERVRPVEKAGELLDRLASRFSANEAETANAVGRLEETVSKLEARSGGNGAVERRLQGIEHTLSDIAGRLDHAEHQSAPSNPIEDGLRALSQQIEASEKRQRESVGELRAAMKDTASRIEALESKAAAPHPAAPQPANLQAAGPQAANGQAPNGMFDLPPFPAAEAPPAPAFLQQNLQPQAFNQPAQSFNPPYGFQQPPAGSGFDIAPPPPPFDAPPPPFAGDSSFGGNSPFGAEAFAANAAQQAGAPVESYLEAARRSAREAAQNQRGARAPAGNFTLGAASTAQGPLKPVVAAPKSRMRFVLIGGIIFIALMAAVVGLMLNRTVTPSNPTVVPNNSTAIIPAKPVTTRPAPTLYEPNPTVPEEKSDTQTDNSDESAVVPPAKAPKQAKTPPGSPVVAQPAQTKAAPQQPKQTAAVPPLQRLTQLATNGDSKSQLLLGLKYLDGNGVAMNEAEAARWLERAANNGEALAQYRLGTLYERGHGVPANAGLAMKWYTAAANAGNRKAMHNLAVAFAEGTSGKKDYAQAAKWFTKAAMLGLADSQFNLAVLYERGLGVQQSLTDAYKWYAIAAVQGDTESKSRIEALSTQLSPADRTAAQSAADRFRPQSMDPNANAAPTAQ